MRERDARSSVNGGKNYHDNVVQASIISRITYNELSLRNGNINNMYKRSNDSCMSDDTFDLMIEMVVASMDEVSLKKKFCRSV